MRPEIGAIRGLRWHRHNRIENGEDSFVIPFPRTRPVNIVYHGHEKFDYGHYGIHLGQEDRLTFLGSPLQNITARFIDCREGSETARSCIEVSFSPSSEWELRIPPGVAHAFSGLENVNTINSYKLFLPDPSDWIHGRTSWDVTSDVINVDIASAPSEVKLYVPNGCDASDVFYDLVNERQKKALPELKHSYPYTTDYLLPDGEVIKIKVTESVEVDESNDWLPLGEIDGLGWQQLPHLKSGRMSGFVPLNDCRPFYVIDHGTENYTHDAFGIHLGQVDHLIFLGNEEQIVGVEFVDCREGSSSLHKKFACEFRPDARKRLVIPMGVAHRFISIENVFTLNQGLIFFNEESEYNSGNDVIDWPVSYDVYPVLSINKKRADHSYYNDLRAAQEKALESGNPRESTPIVVMAKHSDGTNVRVAIRRSE